MFMLINLSTSIYGRPCNAFHSWELQKIDILFHVLCSIITLVVPNCETVVLLYVFNSMHLFTVATNSSLVTFGNSFLKRYVGIILPLLPMSVLNFVFTLFLPANILN